MMETAFKKSLAILVTVLQLAQGVLPSQIQPKPTSVSMKRLKVCSADLPHSAFELSCCEVLDCSSWNDFSPRNAIIVVLEGIQFIIKMNDRSALNSLMDFGDITKQKASLKHVKSEETGEESTDNEMILRSFEDLKKKLRTVQKDNVLLKDEQKISGIRLRQNQQALELALTGNLQLKSEVEKHSESSAELSRRFAQMKGQLQKYNQLEDELAFSKQALLQTKLREKSLIDEKRKMMELFLNQKIEMEEEMAKLKAKTASDDHFITHLEEESVKSKSSNMKLENKMRKMSISYEESTFTHAFNRDNFEAEHQVETIAEMGKEIANLKGKLSKEKERRYLLEDQLVHLEETSGINNVKAATYEGETEMLAKKQSRALKKIEDLNNRLQRMSGEKIVLQEERIKYQLFVEEIIDKLKPMMSEDLVEILQYYETKLKSMSGQQQTGMGEPAAIRPLQTAKPEPNPKNTERRVLEEQSTSSMSYTNTYQSLSHHKTRQPSPIENYESFGKKESRMNGPRFSFGFGEQKQNDTEHVMETKIRNERQEMQRKLKEKMFQKRFDCSVPSGLHRLRSEYINTFIDQ